MHHLSCRLYRSVFFQFLGQPVISRDHSIRALSLFLSERLNERRLNRFVQHLFGQSEQNGVFLTHVADQMLAIEVGRLDESVNGLRFYPPTHGRHQRPGSKDERSHSRLPADR